MKKIINYTGPSVNIEIKIDQGKIASTSLSLTNDSSFSYTVKNQEISKDLLFQLEKWLLAYSLKQPIPVKHLLFLADLPPFTKKILRVLETIPFGEVKTYRQIAEECGNPKGARAAGNSCGKNPWPLLIPCHRVIHSSGSLGGFSSGGSMVKTALLNFEKVQNFLSCR
ncbi:MAG: hypothetical protein Tsb0021_13040 [Chlamydiales bacterium]